MRHVVRTCGALLIVLGKQVDWDGLERAGLPDLREVPGVHAGSGTVGEHGSRICPAELRVELHSEGQEGVGGRGEGVGVRWYVSTVCQCPS